MIDNYFNCLIGLQDIKNEISDLIIDYNRKNSLNVSVVETILLFIIMNEGSICKPKDIAIVTDKSYSNNTYNLKKLIKNGYLVSTKNVTGYFHIDGRCTTLAVTEKGKNFYNGLCEHLEGIFKKSHLNFGPLIKEISCLSTNMSKIKK